MRNSNVGSGPPRAASGDHQYGVTTAGNTVQGGWGGWPTGNGKKLSSCQAQLGQATCLAVA